MAEEFAGLVGDEAGLAGCQPRVASQGETMEHVASFADKRFRVIVHDDHCGALPAVSPPFGTGQGRRQRLAASVKEGLGTGRGHRQATVAKAWTEPVSYTHLTLPTICSV